MSAGRKNGGNKTDWNTPPEIAERVRRFYGGSIDTDPCSNRAAMVHARTEYILPANGLALPWLGRTYVNPPYGDGIAAWLERCSSHDDDVIALIPVAPNTRHWRRFVFGHASAICFLHAARLKFWDAGVPIRKGAPMACCLVYWGARGDEFAAAFAEIGGIVRNDLAKPRPAVEYQGALAY